MKIGQLLILMLLFCQIYSQPTTQRDPYLKFYNLTKKDGLSNNYVLDIIQDKRGFVWIATKDGLNRFNAYEFEIYRNNPDDSLSLSSNIITALTEDSYGNIWIGTKNGLNKYCYENLGFQRFVNNENKLILEDCFVRSLYADKNGLLWIESSNGTLHKYDINSDSLSIYKHRPANMINTYFYHDIFEDENGLIWLGGRNMGILQFNPVTGIFSEILSNPNDSTKKRERDVASYFIDSSGTYWISGIDGLYTFDPNKETFTKMLPVSTFSIQEDEMGKLWCGTGSGIYVYDKNNNSFTTHTHNENNPNTLIADNINKIMIDYSGNIWIGTNDGISIHSLTKNKFKHIYHIPGNENTPSSNYITALLEDKSENIWIGTENDGIDYLDKNFNRISHYGREESQGHQIISNNISSLMQDNEGDIWAGQWSGRGFNIINTKSNKVKSYSKLANSLRVDWYNSIIQDSRNNYWLGLWGGIGLQLFDKEREGFADETFTLININLNAPVFDLVVDNELIWVSFAYQFFAAFNQAKGKYNMYFPENSIWVPNLKIHQVFLDEENKLWFATNNGLFKKVADPYTAFKPYKKTNDSDPHISNDIYSINNSNNSTKLWITTSTTIELFDKRSHSFSQVMSLPMNGDLVNFIYEDKSNYLWVGTKEGLYLKANGQNMLSIVRDFKDNYLFANCYLEMPKGNFWLGTSSGLFKYNLNKRKFEKSNLFDNHEILSLVFDNSNNLWLGTKSGLYNVIGDSIMTYHMPDYGLDGSMGNCIYSIDIDNNGDLWLGTDIGLCQFQKEAKTIKKHNKPEKNYLSSRLTKCIFEDKQGSIWVGTTDKGLNKMDIVTGNINQYKSNLLDSNAFWGIGTTCIMQDMNGDIWLGGYGLNKFDPQKDIFSHYVESNGLVDNNIKGILEDNTGSLWISTKNGLSKFNPKTESFDNFFEKDGLQNNEFTEAFYKRKDNSLMFGGKNGFNVFKPVSIKRNLKVPEVVITKFLIFEQETDYVFPQTKGIELKYNQNYFSFEFACLDFSYPAMNKYSYKLENFDKEWISTDASDRRAKYTNVPSGNYIFRVKASNNDGMWNEIGAQVELNIKPPYWKTLWFYSLEGLLFMMLIIGYIKYREKNIREKNKLLILEQKLLRSQMNPHFIFNSLTSIQSFIFENNPMEAGSYLSRFSNLIRSILYNSREEYILLEKEIQTLENYLEIQQLRYNNEFDYEIIIDPKIDVEMLAVPPMLAQPFIENSVEHGIRQLEKRGWVSVKFSMLNESISLIIEDNGIGIEASKNMKDNKASEHKSLAIVITKERMSILNKRKKKKTCSMQIEDIIGEGGSVEGTRIEFVIPYLIL